MTPEKFCCLSPRQAEVLRLAAEEEESDKCIADRLHCSPHTVRAHLRCIFRRLNVRTKAGAAYIWGRAEASHEMTMGRKRAA